MIARADPNLDRLDANLDEQDLMLTAYVLDELNEDDRSAVELGLSTDQISREMLEEVFSSAHLLKDALGKEPPPPPSPQVREAVEQRLSQRRRHRLRDRIPRMNMLWLPMILFMTLLVILTAWAALILYGFSFGG